MRIHDPPPTNHDPNVNGDDSDSRPNTYSADQSSFSRMLARKREAAQIANKSQGSPQERQGKPDMTQAQFMLSQPAPFNLAMQPSQVRTSTLLRRRRNCNMLSGKSRRGQLQRQAAGAHRIELERVKGSSHPRRASGRWRGNSVSEPFRSRVLPVDEEPVLTFARTRRPGSRGFRYQREWWTQLHQCPEFKTTSRSVGSKRTARRDASGDSSTVDFQLCESLSFSQFAIVYTERDSDLELVVPRCSQRQYVALVVSRCFRTSS